MFKLHFAETQEEETDITIKQNKIFDNTIPYFIRLSKGLFILQLSNSRVFINTMLTGLDNREFSILK